MDGKGKLHVMFFPFPGQGHLIPMSDMARAFSGRGVRATIVTSPLNVPTIRGTIGKGVESEIEILTVKFPCAEAGLPEGCENTESIPSPDLILTFFKAIRMLQAPLEELLLQHRPHCLIASALFPWASKLNINIPRLVFHGTGVFALCASECIRLYQPHKNVSSDTDPFLIPHLPGDVQMTKMLLPDYIKTETDGGTETDFKRALQEIKEAELASYGVVLNSFYELEQVYADYYEKQLLQGQGRRTWYIGPLSLCNVNDHKGKRGKQASVDEGDILKWLDSNKPNSVVYVCFGSIANFSESQLREIARGLEDSGQQFIWVVRRSEKDKGTWLPEGFERRTTTEGRGIIIWGWAPQVLILDHQAVGVFVTHCGWNSTLEAVSAGVPMVTWPVSAEQFYNEKFVTDLLQIGIPVGVQKWARIVGDDTITSNALQKALHRVVLGEEAESMRNRAHELAQMARTAVQYNGSSSCHLTHLIQHLRSIACLQN
uniref:Glycosyltransferase n=1 Tax=Pueraria montana var. lobata TaxID=3893 RepID=E9M5E6_PUEML|nr:glycosyltransferase GT02J01 [Pueraria montana var. lobata]